LKASKEEFNRLIIDKPFEEIIKYDENQFLEFKSTLCWDVKNSKVDTKIMGEIVMKSISAFSNSEGGVLLIGVKNDKKILGLTDDYKTFKNGSGNRDDFELHLTTLIINNFSKTFAKDNLSIEFPKSGKNEICLIRIAKSQIPYTVKISDKTGQQKEKFFVRVKNSSRDIDNLLELARYIKHRFPTWN
jgi:predicted HTH transcriptional regulator